MTLYARTRIYSNTAASAIILPADYQEANGAYFYCMGGGQAGMTPIASIAGSGVGGANGYLSCKYPGPFGFLPGDILPIQIAARQYAANPTILSPGPTDILLAGGQDFTWARGNDTWIKKPDLSPFCYAPGGRILKTNTNTFDRWGDVGLVVADAYGSPSTPESPQLYTSYWTGAVLNVGCQSATGACGAVGNPFLGLGEAGGRGGQSYLAGGGTEFTLHQRTGPAAGAGGVSILPGGAGGAGYKGTSIGNPDGDPTNRNGIQHLKNGVYIRGGHTLSAGFPYGGDGADNGIGEYNGYDGLPGAGWLDTLTGQIAGPGGGGGGGRGGLYYAYASGSGVIAKNKGDAGVSLIGDTHGGNGGNGALFGGGGGGGANAASLSQAAMGIAGWGEQGVIILEYFTTLLLPQGTNAQIFPPIYLPPRYGIFGPNRS